MSSVWKIWSAAPHRVMFLGGAVQLVLAMLYWGWLLVPRYQPLWSLPAHPLPDYFIHAWLMLVMVFPYFMFGFLMTTYPRWMNGPLVSRGTYLRAFFLLAAGSLLYYPSVLAGGGWLAASLLLVLAGWVTAWLGLWRVFRASGSDNRRYERHLNGALGISILLQAVVILVVVAANPVWLRPLVHAALWLYLLPVLFVVAHRMVPFFTSCVLSDYSLFAPGWSLWLFWALAISHWLGTVLPHAALVALADGALTLLLALHLWRWQVWRVFGDRLLAVLFLAWGGFLAGVLLSSVEHVLVAVRGGVATGTGALHLMAIGFVGALVLGMVSRVTLGHSGRALVLDRLAWSCFVGLQAVAVIRYLAETGDGRLFGMPLNLVALAGWLLCVLPWVARYAPRYWRPRVDGNPG